MNDKMASHPRIWLYGFTVAHVQRYLLASPRLRDIQGGSQLLEDLCGGEFDRVRQAVGLGDARILSQAAAGARLETSDADAVARLYAVWPFVAERYAPGVLIQQALVDVDEAGGLAAAQAVLGERLHAARTDPACDLPAAGPLVARYARTGEPVEAEQEPVGGARELVDRATHAKVDAWRKLKTEAREGAGAALDRRYLGPELSKRYRFAAGREDEGEKLSSDVDPYVAVVHADGNAVGRFIAQLLESAPASDESAAVFRRFSQALARATEEAAGEAVREVLVGDLERSGAARGVGDTLPILKARPIVLGGDDLTIILPARLAFDCWLRQRQVGRSLEPPAPAGRGEVDLEGAREEFLRCMEKAVPNWLETEQIVQLLAMADPEAAGDLRYMVLDPDQQKNEFLDAKGRRRDDPRYVLPAYVAFQGKTDRQRFPRT